LQREHNAHSEENRCCSRMATECTSHVNARRACSLR
jgi:hypothetical protein